jgi:hypothetical protein
MAEWFRGLADLEELLKLYPAPTYLRMDNGSATASIAPGSPWENPFLESFNSRFRDEFLNIERYASLQEVKLLSQ